MTVETLMRRLMEFDMSSEIYIRHPLKHNEPLYFEPVYQAMLVETSIPTHLKSKDGKGVVFFTSPSSINV